MGDQEGYKTLIDMSVFYAPPSSPPTHTPITHTHQKKKEKETMRLGHAAGMWCGVYGKNKKTIMVTPTV